MIDHRRHPKNLTRLIAHKYNIFIMIVLITFQNRYQDLHCQLLCQILMRLKICRFQNLRIIIKHLAVIQIIIDLHVLVRILSEKLLQYGFILFSYCCTISTNSGSNSSSIHLVPQFHITSKFIILFINKPTVSHQHYVQQVLKY